MANVTGVLVNAKANTIRKATLDGTLQGYYNALECRCFDIAYRTIGGAPFDIYCDDEGLFAEKPIITAFSPDGEPMLVGNLFVCRHDYEGNTVSLTDDEIRHIMQETLTLITSGFQIRRVLVCDY